jgi:polysaccharide deacetylase 2 family uncharacterized protein YibQ
VDFAATARGATGVEAPIRIVPPIASPGGKPARVLVSLPDFARLAVLEAAWRSAASERGVALERRESAADFTTYAVSAGGKPALLLEVFALSPTAGSDAPAPRAGPALALIVDDLGYDSAAARAVFALPGRVTVAILPNLPDSTPIAEEAHRRGLEVLLHLPMQSLAGEDKAEKVELHVGESAAQVNRELDGMLATVPHAVGVNNHQGSRATADAALMASVAAALRARGLFFVDSRTSGASVAYEAARRAGVPAAARNVFLDDDEQPAAIHRQLDHAVRLAREQGWCVAIGHPHSATLGVLAEALPEVEARGVRLVSASALLQRDSSELPRP